MPLVHRSILEQYPAAPNSINNRLEASFGILFNAMGKQDGIPSREDFEIAFQKLKGIEQKNMRWGEALESVQSRYLNVDWIKNHAPWASELIPFVEDPTHNKQLFWASVLWLADQLKGMQGLHDKNKVSTDIRVTPRWIPNGLDGGHFFTQEFLPVNQSTDSLQTIVFLPGSFANAFLYSEAALTLARMGYQVITTDHPSGPFSEGYLNDSKRVRAWGNTGPWEYDYATGRALENVLEAYHLFSGSFLLAPHSAGLFSVLGWLKNSNNATHAAFKGVVEMAGGWASTKRNASWLALSHLIHPERIYPYKQGSTQFVLKDTVRGDPQALTKTAPFFATARAPMYQGHSTDLFEWHEGRGSLHEAFKGLIIRAPWSSIIAPLDDANIDSALSIQRMSDHFIGAPVRLRAIGQQHQTPIKQRWRLKKFEAQLEAHAERFDLIDWTQVPISHFMQASPEAIQILAEEARFHFGKLRENGNTKKLDFEKRDAIKKRSIPPWTQRLGKTIRHFLNRG